MADPSSPNPTPDDLIRRYRRIRWQLWLWVSVALVGVAVALAFVAPLAVRFPAASVPAILGAAFGYFRARRRGIGLGTQPKNQDQLPRSQQFALLWGALAGAVGYGALAALRLGVPAPEAPLGWRVAGGVIFGAAAGIGAGCFMPLLELVTMVRRRKRAA